MSVAFLQAIYLQIAITSAINSALRKNLPSRGRSSPRQRRARGTRAAAGWRRETGRRCSRCRRFPCRWRRSNRRWAASCPRTAAGCRRNRSPASGCCTRCQGRRTWLRAAAGSRSSWPGERWWEGPHGNLVGIKIQLYQGGKKNQIKLRMQKVITPGLHDEIKCVFKELGNGEGGVFTCAKVHV